MLLIPTLFLYFLALEVGMSGSCYHRYLWLFLCAVDIGYSLLK